ncbi:MAG: prenyltransferase/squalene oxidase repeat-containing protein [bacterium]
MKTEQDVIDRLKRLPSAVVSHDLAPEILAKVRAEANQKTGWIPSWRWVLPLAASLAVLLGGLWLAGARPMDPGRQAVAWLRQIQEPDGSWSVAKWGGDKQFEIALTGLSLMTLMDGAPGADPAIDKAIAYLLQQQHPDGRFGERVSGMPYNQGIATLALAKACERHPSEPLRLALEKAVAVICAGQYADGGWGYYHEAHPASNLSITLWQIEALRLAATQGLPQVRPRVERGLRWMAGVAADDGSFGYQKSGDTPGGASQTLTAMGAMSLLDPAHIGLVSPGRRQAIKAQVQRLASAPGPDMDYYRRYFLTAALKKMDETSAHQGLTAMRQDLVARQIKRGDAAGSWTADPRWGSSGGRIYATAMASLSLR